MNNSKVLQCPTGTEFLVKCSGSQLQIQTHVMNQLISFTNNSSTADLPVAIICAVGQPSTGKTAYADAIMRHFHSIAALHEFMITGFPDPKRFEHDDKQKIDGILVSAPPFIVEDIDGRCAGVILLDVWNNGTMSEDVYMKLMDFCFYVSSIQIIIAGGPLRPISWWIGDYPSISNEQEERHWLNITYSLSKPQDGDEASGSYLIVRNGQSSVRKLCRSIHDLDKGSLDMCNSDFEFIIEQILSPQAEAKGCRLSGLVAHFKRGVAYVNNPLPTTEPESPVKEEDHVDRLATKMDMDRSNSPAIISSSPFIAEATAAASPESHAVSQYELVGALTECVYQAYAGSPHLYLCSEAFLQLLGQFDHGALSSHPHCALLRTFHETIQFSQEVINTELPQGLANICTVVEQNLDFESDSGGLKVLQYLQDLRTDVHLKANFIATAWATRLQLQQLHLPRETEIFTAKLSTKIQREILNFTEYLQQQIKLGQDTLARHKDMLCQSLQLAVCISEEKFENIAQFSRSPLAQILAENLGPAFKTAVKKAAANYEQQLRLHNQQAFHAEFDFARTALSNSIIVMEQLLTSHLRQHKIMTDKELSDTFDSLCTTVKKACSSVPEFFLNDAWEAAWEDLRPSLQKFHSQLRRQNHNGIRKWNRELCSAIEKSTLVYNQEMDRRLPIYRLPAMELDKIHFECAQHTLEKFTVSPEVNEETRNYWIRVLELSKLKEWKQGYAMLNEKKKLPTPPKEMATALDYENSPAKLPDLAACHVGIYFGPELIIFTALVSNGPEASSEISHDFPVTLKIKPFLAFRRGKIVYGEQALRTKSRNGTAFNIFNILAELSKPTKPSQLAVEMDGQKVSVTPEAAAVLFFREAINQLAGITGRRAQTCTVAHPGQLQGEAITSITEAIKIAGFSKVNLIPITTSLASSYVYPLLKRSTKTAKRGIQFVTVYYAGEILEISLIQMTDSELEVKSMKAYFDFRRERKEEENVTKQMRKCLAKITRKDLFATVLMFGTEDEDNGLVQDTFIKLVGDLNCPYNQVECSSGIAQTVAEIDAGISANPHRSHQPGLSSDSKVPPAWDRETLKVQVEHLVRLMEPGTPQPSPQKEVINEEGHKIAPEVDGLRYQLAQLVQRVEEALEKSSACKGPLYGFINQSVRQCQQLLQIATTSDMELTMAMNKLQIRSEDLLKGSSE